MCFLLCLENEIIEKIDIIYEFDYDQKAIKILYPKKRKCNLIRVNLSKKLQNDESVARAVI